VIKFEDCGEVDDGLESSWPIDLERDSSKARARVADGADARKENSLDG